TILDDDPTASMATLATPIRSHAIYHDPSCVKVVRALSGHALYFSRSPVPHHRDGLPDPTSPSPFAYLHIGLYAYRRDFLLK
ncbi:cytidylyltransferase domain-containing protein, partial [Klebsiella pneumoniae]|uniref:cytidylyltransferase domain-containing protein n=1 Tax=Klebsiella pneumoniae TaxID=573 RepID=UPI0030716301